MVELSLVSEITAGNDVIGLYKTCAHALEAEFLVRIEVLNTIKQNKASNNNLVEAT
ncbi:MAG: hypothetical protein M3P33_02360 [bacterium]|nr:hypothetical protein [bacterium]